MDTRKKSSSWSSSGRPVKPPRSKAGSSTALLRGVREALDLLRAVVPSYGTRPATDAEINALLEARGIEMYVVDMDDVIFVTPGRGKKPPRVFIAAHLRASERRFWLLHDIVHFFVGDADEHARHDDYDPYPIFEQRADVVAALGVLPVKSRSGDAQWFDLQLDELVPTKHVAWTVFRRPSTADMVSRVFSERVA